MTRTGRNENLFVHKVNAMYDRVYNAVLPTGHVCLVFYAAYPVDDKGYPIDNLDLVPFRGRVQVGHTHDATFGDGTDYCSPVLESPTWLQLALLANEMIVTTGDEHHCFFEGIFTTGARVNGALLCEFSMGS